MALVFWQRVILTALAMVLASVIAAELWRAAFSFELPSYLSGLIGGMVAIPVWELCKQTKTQA
jgi:Na+/glutamate symporter